MMQRPMRSSVALALGAALLVALSGCGDQPQTGSTAPKKADAKAWDGGATAVYTAPGWQQGDRNSWEQQLKARNQQQNEYTRSR